MTRTADLIRYAALQAQAHDLEAQARTAPAADRDDMLRDAIATRARMLELERDVA